MSTFKVRNLTNLQYFNFLKILIFYNVLAGCLGDITIDTEEELNAVGFTTCDYMETYAELCKIAPSTPNSGFWSSCAIPSGNCDLSIRIADLEELPEFIEIHKYLSGSVTEMRLRHQSADSSRPINVEELPKPETGMWDIYTYDLTTIEDFTVGSIINIRFSSIPGARDFPDILDKIVFKFPIEPTTTTKPRIETIIDIEGQLNAVGFTTCDYMEIYQDLCKISPSTPNSGFWSSCAIPSGNCDLTIRIENLEEIPGCIEIYTYLSGSANEMRLRHQSANASRPTNIADIPKSETGTWQIYTHDLTTIEDFTVGSIIIIRFSSIPGAREFPDILDKIVFKYSCEVEPTTITTTPTTTTTRTTRTTTRTTSTTRRPSTTISEIPTTTYGGGGSSESSIGITTSNPTTLSSSSETESGSEPSAGTGTVENTPTTTRITTTTRRRSTTTTPKPPEEDSDNLLVILLIAGGGILLVALLVGARAACHFYTPNHRDVVKLRRNIKLP